MNTNERKSNTVKPVIFVPHFLSDQNTLMGHVYRWVHTAPLTMASATPRFASVLSVTSVVTQKTSPHMPQFGACAAQRWEAEGKTGCVQCTRSQQYRMRAKDSGAFGTRPSGVLPGYD
jgi:hypothetical protein